MKPIVAVVFLAGCQLEAEPAAPVAPHLIDSVLAVQRHMHERFAAVRGVEDAIARGNLDLARANARTIASLEEPDVLPAWQPYLDSVRQAAAQVDQATNLVGAAKQTGELGRRCATCHEAATAKIRFAGQPRPPADVHLPMRMLQHQWAVERMWEGLIAPSDDRWYDGAKALQEAPLTFVAESSALGIADDVSRVHLLADRAMRPASNAERAQLFGELLGTCARCHAVIRDR